MRRNNNENANDKSGNPTNQDYYRMSNVEGMFNRDSVPPNVSMSDLNK